LSILECTEYVVFGLRMKHKAVFFGPRRFKRRHDSIDSPAVPGDSGEGRYSGRILTWFPPLSQGFL
jgi:hypothetical protein